MKSISLFSGINGMSVGKPILYCDNNIHAQEVLQARMDDGSIPTAPIHEDIRTLEELPAGVDIITAGFPCQDLSSAGLKQGLKGKRSGLFYHVVRLARQARPPLVFMENVNNLRMLPQVWKTVLREMAIIGYDSKWVTISAEEAGAPHKRQRWFCLCNLVRADATVVSNTSDDGKENTKTPEDASNDILEHVDTKMYPCGSYINGQYIEDPLVTGGKVSSLELVLTPITGKRKCQSTNLVTKPLKRRRFPTLRTNGGSFPALGLTKRCSHDLATVLRFENQTPDSQRWVRHGRPNSQWAEWLMGFPIGWTNPDVSLKDQKQHNEWVKEPNVPRLITSNMPNSHALLLLGNCCVPAQADFAFAELTNRLRANIPKYVHKLLAGQ